MIKYLIILLTLVSCSTKEQKDRINDEFVNERVNQTQIGCCEFKGGKKRASWNSVHSQNGYRYMKPTKFHSHDYDSNFFTNSVIIMDDTNTILTIDKNGKMVVYDSLIAIQQLINEVVKNSGNPGYNFK